MFLHSLLAAFWESLALVHQPVVVAVHARATFRHVLCLWRSTMLDDELGV